MWTWLFCTLLIFQCINLHAAVIAVFRPLLFLNWLSDHLSLLLIKDTEVRSTMQRRGFMCNLVSTTHQITCEEASQVLQEVIQLVWCSLAALMKHLWQHRDNSRIYVHSDNLRHTLYFYITTTLPTFLNAF